MRQQMPSLNALRAFEAAARHENFSKAADELCVTHVAISRHVRELEAWLDLSLFARTGRGVALTEAGRVYLAKLTPVFDDIVSATREIKKSGKGSKLQVTSDPAIAARWLVSHLRNFKAKHPDIEVSIDPSDELSNIEQSEYDIGIRYGYGGWPNVNAVEIFRPSIFPVCAPEFVRENAIYTVRDLKEAHLLHEESYSLWIDWLKEAGATHIVGDTGPRFHNHLAIDAAQSGQGFALCDQILCFDALKQGALATPFDHRLQERGNYYLVFARDAPVREAVKLFVDWLVEEISETVKEFDKNYAHAREKA